MWPFKKESRLGPDALPAVKRLCTGAGTTDEFHGVVDLLLAGHPPCRPSLAGPPPSRRLTREQNTLASAAVLDQQVENGGLLQLFWNCPGRLEHIGQSLREIGPQPLADAYERAIEQLGEQFETFARLRAGRNPASGFIAAAEMFDFDWFDDLYLGRYRNGELIEPGANLQLHAAALRYVDTNVSGFVRQ